MLGVEASWIGIFRWCSFVTSLEVRSSGGLEMGGGGGARAEGIA